MPGRDQSGPYGKGPFGRGMGPCGAEHGPHGFFGHGWRAHSRRSERMMAKMLTPEEEKSWLEEQKDWLELQLKPILKRLGELDDTKKEE